MKRAASTQEAGSLPAKRVRLLDSKTDRISRLSHELTLRILSGLSVGELAVCHRVSKHFQSLCCDSQLWKAHYYNRFVRPRAARIPGVRDTGSETALYFSSKLSRWLDEDKLVRRGRETNWKRQYKLRHNWAQGTCSVSEIPVSESPSVPPLLVAMQESTIFLADREDGLRAWNSASGKEMLARISWDSLPEHNPQSPPSSLAVDAAKPDSATVTRLAVGFQDGSFAILELDHTTQHFRQVYRHAPSSNGMLTAIALCTPYLSTMTATQVLSVYTFPLTTLDSPTLVHSLHSTSVLPPLTLSIRPTPNAILISTAYTLQSVTSPLLGIQELHLDPQTSLPISSRLATSAPLPSRPTTLTYSHPYLLAANADNTLTLHQVTSSAAHLGFSPAQVLWGHTSAVAGASIGPRGRAVSVSRAADVRVWDLEARIAKKTAPEGVRVVPSPEPGAGRRREWGRFPGWEEEVEMGLARGWVGFDEENVVLLKERMGRGQSLVVYDFAS